MSDRWFDMALRENKRQTSFKLDFETARLTVANSKLPVS
jgi:hypothetical protein